MKFAFEKVYDKIIDNENKTSEKKKGIERND